VIEKITHLVTGSTKMTPSMAIADAVNFDFSDVMIIGYQDGELVVRSSEMTRKDAVWILLEALDHSRQVAHDRD